MEVTANQSAYQVLGAMVKGMADVQLPAAGEGKEAGKFQELLEKQQSADKPDSKAPEQPAKSEKPAAQKPEKARTQEQEDPVETVKKAQVLVVGQLEPDAVVEPVILEAPEAEVEIIVAVGDQEPQAWTYRAAPEEIAAEPQLQTADAELPLQAKTEAELQPEQPEEEAEAAAAVPEQAGQVEAKAENSVQVEAKPEQTADVQARPEEDREEVTVTDAEQAPQQLFHEVKAAPIKVGETGAARETREVPDVETQVDTGLAEALAHGESRVEIRLDPANLGSVKVEITRTAEGTLHVAMSAENSQTRSLLEKHAVNLQHALGARTQDEVRVEVQKQAESQRRDENPYEGHSGHARQQQEQRRQERGGNREDFLQRLRLGLIPEEDG